MEKTYWLERQRASLKAAQRASGSVARLIHFDLAGRYGLKAESPQTAVIDLEIGLPVASNPYRLIIRRAEILCVVALLIVGFNIFASSQQNETVQLWSVALTVSCTLVGITFTIWAARTLTAKIKQPRELRTYS